MGQVHEQQMHLCRQSKEIGKRVVLLERLKAVANPDSVEDPGDQPKGVLGALPWARPARKYFNLQAPNRAANL